MHKMRKCFWYKCMCAESTSQINSILLVLLHIDNDFQNRVLENINYHFDEHFPSIFLAHILKLNCQA